MNVSITSNNSVVNQPSYNDDIPVSDGYLMNCLLVVWLFNIYGVYLVSLIIKYLREKPPNLQTLLDGFQIQFFVSWIIFGIMTIISEGVLVLNTLGIENKTITYITAWIGYSSIVFISVSMVTSCVARAILIFLPSIVESIQDKKIWLLNG